MEYLQSQEKEFQGSYRLLLEHCELKNQEEMEETKRKGKHLAKQEQTLDTSFSNFKEHLDLTLGKLNIYMGEIDSLKREFYDQYQSYVGVSQSMMSQIPCFSQIQKTYLKAMEDARSMILLVENHLINLQKEEIAMFEVM